jgi:tetratricopeptide (TPR) repeat protein
VRFVGRIWPEVLGSLIEFGYGLDVLDVRLLRDEDRGSSGWATARLKATLNRLTEANPRHWQAQLAQAVLAWAEHRHQESRRRLEIIPKNLTGETRLIAQGLASLLWQEEGHHARAWAGIQRLVQQYPQRADFWALAGESLWQLKRPQEAQTALVRCLEIGEIPVPHLPPGYASYTARLKLARAEIAAHQEAPGLAHLLNLIEEYPGYRAAWQEVLSHLREVPVEEVFSAMSTVIAPSKIRHFCLQLANPTEDERRLAEWLEFRGLNN